MRGKDSRKGKCHPDMTCFRGHGLLQEDVPRKQQERCLCWHDGAQLWHSATDSKVLLRDPVDRTLVNLQNI